MRTAACRLAMCLLCCVAGLLGGSAVAFAEGASGLGGSDGTPLESPLVVAEAQPLLGGESVTAAEEARRDSPEAVLAREASRTAFAGLVDTQAAKVDGEAFPRLLNVPAGGPPQLPSGESISAYLSANAATVTLPGGASGIVESLVPFARTTTPGHFSQLDLAPNPAGEGWEPASPLVGVRIAKHIAAGVALPAAGVSLTPVDAHGTPLAGGEGAASAAGVLFANTLTDADTLVKASTFGFALDTILRSVASPQELFFRVGMPQGASLVQSEANGAVHVVKDGVTLAEILPVSARDATGLMVPTSVAVLGNMLSVNVNDQSPEYQWPVEVDPEFVQTTDTQFPTESAKSMWEYRTYNGKETTFAKRSTSEYLESYAAGSYSATEWGAWVYETQGESKIWELTSESEAKNTGGHIESKLEIASSGGKEEEQELSSEAKKTAEYAKKTDEPPLCGQAEKKRDCAAGSGAGGNAVWFVQSAAAAGSKFSDRLYNATVQIAEPKGMHSEPSFNKAEEELHFKEEKEGKEVEATRKNALYGTGGWLGKSEGALELEAADKGIGVAATELEYENAGKWEVLTKHNYREEGKCKGVQCYDPHIPAEYWTLNEALPNGEDKIRYRAEEEIGAETRGESEATIKVAKTPPRHLVIQGLPYGNELSERVYELTTEATDGEGTTIASPGIKAIEGEGMSAVKGLALFVDGHEAKEVGKQTGCSVPKGECTASAKWTINGAELGAGHHAIVLVAKDRAGNEQRLPSELTVRHSTPVALGPGSVDLESGDFSMEAGDVSLGGLTVSRNYSSRDTTQGDEGPLGPEWSLSLGNMESLVELVDGSILMTAANGSQTIFAKTETTTYESPPGDSNLSLTVEENKETKQKLAFVLTNAADHTAVKFTLPGGGVKEWVPTSQEGTAPTDTFTFKYEAAEGPNEYSVPSGSGPESIASGPGGTLWYADRGTSKIGKITTTGAITEYALPAKSEPAGIVEGPEGNMWFTEEARDVIGKITMLGVITEYMLPGSGNAPCGIAKGPDGNLWFTEHSANPLIGKITPAGVVTEYSGVASESLPCAIAAGRNNDLWFGEYHGGKIGKITTSGEIKEYSTTMESIEGLAQGPEGKVWFTAHTGIGATHVGSITESGEIQEHTLPALSDAEGITEGPEGDLWFTTAKLGAGAIDKMTPSWTVTEYPLPKESGAISITLGPDGNLWYTTVGTGEIGEMPASGVITRPVQELAPVPSGSGSCSWVSKPTEMPAGCRALEFEYASETTAKGESESEWGEYKRRLTKVLMVAYNPASGHEKMEEKPVAEYSYDKLGRLRAEVNPRTGLKIEYGYNENGQISALNPPGEEPWTFTYGTATADAGMGRLLKMTRSPASAALWNGESVKNTEAPVIAGSPVVGVRLAVSTGKWSGNPVSYGYQWEECASSGSCTAILGATNANYTPTAGSVGHTLVALVTASNGGGSSVTTTAATATVVGLRLTQTIDSGNSVNAVSCLPSTTDCVVSDSKGNALYATNVSTSANATWSSWSGPSGESPSQAVACPASSVCVLADGKETAGGKLYYATSLGGAFSEAYSPSYGVDALSCVSASFCVSAQDKSGYFRYSTNPASSSWTLEQQGTASMKGVFCLSSSFCAIADGAGKVHVATSTSQIESSSWKETDVDGSTALNGVACTATTSCVAVDGAGNLLNLAIESSGAATATKHDIDGTNSLTAITCTGSSTCVTVDNAGNVFVSTNGGETWTKQDQLGDKLTSVSCASTSLCLAADTTGNVTAFNPSITTVTEGEAKAAGPGATIDYDVPVTGSGAPHNMSESEVAKWGQKGEETPVEATAIFPPNEPQGWPASGYKRATIYYLDELGRQVNVASPSTATYGSISTTEYNEYNDVTRTLTADNRATALAAGEEKSAETAKLLSTENRYNEPECQNEQPGEVAEPGTRLCETFGPQHEIRLQHPNGHGESEVLARNHEEFFYDQGVPKEKPYDEETFNLVTETSDLALDANREDLEVRTTKTSYSGQNNAGWKLREPTSVTVEPRSKESNPNGLNLTRTTIYNETTGQVEETRGAAAEHTLTFAKTVSENGTEAGKLKDPSGVAIDSKGDVWVADTANNRIEEFSAEGAYLGKFGEAGSEAGKLKEPKGLAFDSKGDLWVADTGNNRIEEYNPTEGKYLGELGSEGSEKGKLKAPTAIAFDASGNLWVADTGNNRVEKFSVSEGKATSEFGEAGSEPGKLKEPAGIAISEGNVWVADTGNNRIQEFSSSGTLLKHFAAEGSGEGQLKGPAGLAIDANGNIWATDELNGRVEAFTASGGYLSQFGWKGTGHGQLSESHAIAVDAHGNMWVADSANNRIAEFSPGPNAHDEKTIYYSAEANEADKTCGKHPEWAGLVCQTLPAKQPELAALPKLPVTTTTYNMWLEPEKIEESFTHYNTEGKEETAIRTRSEKYNEAGEMTGSETTATGSSDKKLPEGGVTIEYNKETGLIAKQSTSEGSITNEYDRLGRLVKYTEAAGNTATYKYAEPEGGGQLEEVSDSHEELHEGKERHSFQRYSYQETTGLLEKLEDSAAGTFTASYDAEGKMSSETYPNGMCAKYAYNPVGEATSLQYVKSTNCNETEPLLYSDTRIASIHGEMLEQTSTLASETYTYDTAGRLTEAQETPAGEGCSVRAYTYDEESNRVSLTTRKPGSKTECLTEGGTTEAHNYDEANRLTDTGIAYEAFGNIEKLPAADAEGHELTTTYYVDGAVATQSQNGVSHEYKLDPEGRITETTSSGKKLTSHYDGPGEAVAWTSEEEGKKTTRNIPGIDGSLSAVQTNNETPEIQLHDLQGDIIATIGDSTSETKLKNTYNPTEFGAPNNGKAPPKYAWLGASDVADELASGVITYGATSYVPQDARALQAEQVIPPGLPAGSGVGTAVTFEVQPWVIGDLNQVGAEAPGREAGREREAYVAACKVDPESCGGIDPWHVLVLFTPGEAIAYGEVLCNCGVVKFEGQAIEAIAKKIHLEGLGEVFEEFMDDGFAERFGKRLLECGRYLSSNNANRCSIEIDTWEIPGIEVDSYVPISFPEVGICFYFKKSAKGQKRGLHCPHGEFYKQGTY